MADRYISRRCLPRRPVSSRSLNTAQAPKTFLLAAALLSAFYGAVGGAEKLVTLVGDVTENSAEFRVLLPPGTEARLTVQGTELEVVLSATWETGRFARWTATGLSRGTTYNYTVQTCNWTGRSTGRFSTLPGPAAPANGLRLSLVAGLTGANMCRQTWQGFPILPYVRDWEPAFVIGLGDMINAEVACKSTGAVGQPQVRSEKPGTAWKKTDFHSRWRDAFEDEGVRDVLAGAAYFPTWDDGEILGGAGPALDRRFGPWDGVPDGLHLLPAALEAMMDANPVTAAPNTPGRIYRSFQVGQAADVFLLDVRQYRDPPMQGESSLFPKTMLGLEQRTWLLERLSASKARWKILVSSVPISIAIGESDVSSSEWPSELGDPPRSLRDGWASGGQRGGYQEELREIMEHMKRRGFNNVIWATGSAGRSEVLRIAPLPEEPDWIVHEVAVGPLNARVSPTDGSDIDGSAFWDVESLFRWAPEDTTESYESAKEFFTFTGLVFKDLDLELQIINGNGKRVHSMQIKGLPDSPRVPLPHQVLGGAKEYVVAGDSDRDLVAYVGDATTDSVVAVVMPPRGGKITVEFEKDEGGGNNDEAPKKTSLTLFAARWSGFFAKGRVRGLEPNSRYKYTARMMPLGDGGGSDDDDETLLETRGSFRTLPAPGTRRELKLAFFGDLAGQNVCRDRDDGFPALGALADYGPEVVVGLGDVVYVDHQCEDEGKFGNRQIPHPRPPPGGCLVCLPNFWDHCRYNHEDRHFKAALRDSNFIGIWDDHEGVNDFGPHLDLRFNKEPSYPENVHLLPFGLKGMLDCSPTIPAPNTPKRLYRHFPYGDVADIFVLDTRQYRDPSVQSDSDVSPKTMLGLEQRTWLIDALERSTATWTIMVSSMPLTIPTGSEYKPEKWPDEMGPEPETWRDGWTAGDQTGGYEVEMRTILRAMIDSGHRNVVFIATDVHCSFVYRHVPFRDTPEFEVHEIITGPINADLFPKRGFSKEMFHETTRLFGWFPKNRRDVKSWREAKKYFNFGVIEIQPDGDLTAQARDAEGTALHTLRLKAESRGRRSPSPQSKPKAPLKCSAPKYTYVPIKQGGGGGELQANAAAATGAAARPNCSDDHQHRGVRGNTSCSQDASDGGLKGHPYALPETADRHDNAGAEQKTPGALSPEDPAAHDIISNADAQAPPQSHAAGAQGSSVQQAVPSSTASCSPTCCSVAIFASLMLGTFSVFSAV